MLTEGDRQQLERVASLLQEVLGRDLVAAYLFGSAVLGGLRPQSDLDVLAVSARPTTHDEKRALVERLLQLSGRSGRRRVELTLVVEPEIKPWRFPPSFDFQYGDWLREAFERGDLEPWLTRTNADLAALITMALLADTPVLGPPPSDLFDPVPSGDLLSAIVGDVDALLGELETDTRNVVLTLARIWSTVVTGEIRSKDAAADWALVRLPDEHRPVLARARAIYVGDEEERWDDLGRDDVGAFADQVVREIHRAAGVESEHRRR